MQSVRRRSRSIKMHCFICVTYLMIIATAHPPEIREDSRTYSKRSIFNDVIQSLRMRAQLPEDIDVNEENNIGKNYESYSHDPLQLPSDIEFMPRRNDRIEMPSLKYRFPKSLNHSNTTANDKEEIVVFVNTPIDFESKPTQKPKKPKPTRATINKNKINKDNDVTEKPFMYSMGGESQIGNRESQTVVKPTVIVNFRGSVMNRESEIRLERMQNRNDSVPQNIFNINQDIKLEGINDMRSTGDKSNGSIKQDASISSKGHGSQIEEDMMMCETSNKNKEGRSSRNYDVLQILFRI